MKGYVVDVYGNVEVAKLDVNTDTSHKLMRIRENVSEKPKAMSAAAGK